MAILATLIFGGTSVAGAATSSLQDLCTDDEQDRRSAQAFPLATARMGAARFRALYVRLAHVQTRGAIPGAQCNGGRKTHLAPRGRRVPRICIRANRHGLLGDIPASYIAIPFFLVIGFAAVYFLGSKGFCTYGCPYGGIFGVVDKVSPDASLSTTTARVAAIARRSALPMCVHEEIRDFGMVMDPGCMKCMDCVSAARTMR